MKEPSRENYKVAAKVTSKGQVTIPRSVRKKLSLQPGESVAFEDRDGDIIVTRVMKTSSFGNWVGFLADLKGRRSDDLLREARGDDQRR